MIGPIPPIQPFTAAAGPSGTAGAASPAGGVASTNGPAGTAGSGNGFGAAVTNALGQLQQTQTNASNLAAQAAAGQGNVADALIASTQASVDTQVTVAVTNKAIAAFTDIMNMQV